jgi:hypothetical protein
MNCAWVRRFVIERSPDLVAKVRGDFNTVGRQ